MNGRSSVTADCLLYALHMSVYTLILVVGQKIMFYLNLEQNVTFSFPSKAARTRNPAVEFMNHYQSF